MVSAQGERSMELAERIDMAVRIGVRSGKPGLHRVVLRRRLNMP